MLLVDGCEQVVEPADAFGHAEEQIAAGLQRIVEGRQDPMLQFLAEIDQEVSA
jgi:hypothetical protein